MLKIRFASLLFVVRKTIPLDNRKIVRLMYAIINSSFRQTMTIGVQLLA